MLLAMSFMAHARIYEWTDADGVRQFTDREPIGVEYRIRDDGEESLTTYSPVPVPRVPPSSGSGSDNRPPARSAAGKGKGAAADRAERCANYRQRLDRIQNQLRAGYREPRGNQLRRQRRQLTESYRRDCT